MGITRFLFIVSQNRLNYRRQFTDKSLCSIDSAAWSQSTSSVGNNTLIELVAGDDGPARAKDPENLSDLTHMGVDKNDDKVKSAAAFWVIGAGNENRTRNWSLGSSRDTFSPYPRTVVIITS